MTPEEMHNAMERGLEMKEISSKTGLTIGQVAGRIFRYRKKNCIDVRIGEKNTGRAIPINKRYIKVPYIPARPDGFLGVLERNGCRYIEGDIRDGSAVYCAAMNEKRGYCEKHHAMCYRPADNRKIDKWRD